MILLFITKTFFKDTVDLDAVNKLIQEQMNLTSDTQDIPLLQKLHRQSAKKRRAEIAKFKDGQVSELAGKFPLMKDVRFVSKDTLKTVQGTLGLYILQT